MYGTFICYLSCNYTCASDTFRISRFYKKILINRAAEIATKKDRSVTSNVVMSVTQYLWEWLLGGADHWCLTC